jgi:hypothetical protein
MEQIINNLKIIYWSLIAGIILLALFVELFWIDETGGAGTVGGNFEFIFMSFSTLLTMGALYGALRLFKIQKVEEQIKSNPLEKYHACSVIRMALLEFPVMLNIIGYMLFINTSFVWLGLIAFMGFFFIYPSKERFISETGYIEE